MARFQGAISALEESVAIVQLDPLPIDCATSVSGCPGCTCRGLPRELRLDLAAFAARPVLHGRYAVDLDEAEVWRSARFWYALQLLGLLCGALAGHALALGLEWPADLPTLLGAGLGTFAAWLFSKRRVHPYSVRIVATSAEEHS